MPLEYLAVAGSVELVDAALRRPGCERHVEATACVAAASGGLYSVLAGAALDAQLSDEFVDAPAGLDAGQHEPPGRCDRSTPLIQAHSAALDIAGAPQRQTELGRQLAGGHTRIVPGRVSGRK
jgi:hypothetical protein